MTAVAAGVASVGLGLIVIGLSATVMGYRRSPRAGMPSGVRSAVAANILFLAFFALELSDGLVRQDGRIFYWTTVLFLPALLLLGGVLAGRRWAWWTFRGASGLGAAWFLGFVLLIPFANLRGDGGPVPWYGRVYMATVSFAFAGVLAIAFLSLGRADTRSHFGLGASESKPTTAS